MPESSHAPRSPLAVLGIPFDPLTLDHAVDAVAAMIRARRPCAVAAITSDLAVRSLDDVELRRVLFDSNLALCDSTPVLWASRLLDRPLPERVRSSDLVARLLAEGERRRWRIFFLGGQPRKLSSTVGEILDRHPGLHVVGAYAPPAPSLHDAVTNPPEPNPQSASRITTGVRPTCEAIDAEIFKRIGAARPDLLFVAFPCPLQEKWIGLHFRNLGVPVTIGVGSSLRSLGACDAPGSQGLWRTGADAAVRMLFAPGRLVLRYARIIEQLGPRIFTQVRLLKSGPSQPSNIAASCDPALVNPGPVSSGNSVGATQGSANPDASTRPPWSPGAQWMAPHRLDAAAVARLSGPWTDASQTANVFIDLGETQFVDSSGVGFLIRLRKRLELTDRKLTLCRPSEAITRALRLMGIEEFFQYLPSLPVTHPNPRPPPNRPAAEFAASHLGLSLQWRGEITALTRDEVHDLSWPRIGALPPGSGLDVDLAEVSFIDSSGIGLLLKLKKCARDGDVVIRFRNASRAVRNVARLSRLEEYLLDDSVPAPRSHLVHVSADA